MTNNPYTPVGVPQNVIKSNILTEDLFKDRTKNVFSFVANALSRTLGPYGAPTILEQVGEYKVTKDGFNVLKRIHFDNPIEENIMNLLVNISSQVVIKVGDGSTSSIVAAHHLLQELEKVTKQTNLRSKELVTRLQRIIRVLTTKIKENATKIEGSMGSTFHDIYRVAMISTNGDEHVSEIIRSIYEHTNNPAIEFKNGNDANHTYEIINGYQANVKYIDPIFVTNDMGVAEAHRPIVLLFDHRLDRHNHLEFIQIVLDNIRSQRRKLVVVAPGYDKSILQVIKALVNDEVRRTGETSIIFTAVEHVRNMDKAEYADLAALLGTEVISENTIYEYNEVEYVDTEAVDTAGNIVRVPQRKNEINPLDYTGECEMATIGHKKTLFSGFYNQDTHIVEIQRKAARAAVDELLERHSQFNIVGIEMYEARNRLSKLLCRMGVIYVGGSSSLERGNDNDAIEDAVRACESAYRHGYNLGGNFAIQLAANEVLGSINEFKSHGFDDTDSSIIAAIKEAFKKVFFTVLHNAYENDSTKNYDEIFNGAIESKKCYDILTETYSGDVINPAHTDVEILSGALSIVSLILSSNQYISTAPIFETK